MERWLVSDTLDCLPARPLSLECCNLYYLIPLCLTKPPRRQLMIAFMMGFLKLDTDFRNTLGVSCGICWSVMVVKHKMCKYLLGNFHDQKSNHEIHQNIVPWKFGATIPMPVNRKEGACLWDSTSCMCILHRYMSPSNDACIRIQLLWRCLHVYVNTVLFR